MTETAAARLSKAPLFVIAGSHGSLHWALATFYLLLPFIQKSLGLTYTEAGALASVIDIASFAANLPSGFIVDVSGRRLVCQLVSLVVAAAAIAGLGFTADFSTIVGFSALLAVMNTLWHPAAISFLSSRYAQNRGLALSFHTIGASIGDALAPMAIGTLIAVAGWQVAAIAGAAPPLLAAAIVAIFFVRGSGVQPEHLRSRSSGGLAGYAAGMARLVKDLRVWVVCGLAGLRGTTQAGLRAFLPLYVVNELGAGAVLAGVVMLAFQAAGAVTTPAAGALSDRFGRRGVLVVALTLGACATCSLPSISQEWLYVVMVAVVGGSTFSLRPVIQGWALDITPPELGGSTISILFGTQAAFAMTVPLLGGMVADVWGLASACYLFASVGFAGAALAAGLGGFAGGAAIKDK